MARSRRAIDRYNNPNNKSGNEWNPGRNRSKTTDEQKLINATVGVSGGRTAASRAQLTKIANSHAGGARGSFALGGSQWDSGIRAWVWRAS